MTETDETDSLVKMSEVRLSPTWRHYSFFVISALYITAFAVESPLVSQYLYYRIESDLLGNSSFGNDTTKGSFCTANASDEGFVFQQRVQAVAATWSQYFSLAGGIPNVFTVLLAGSWSDFLGRKVVAVVGMAGRLVWSVVYLAVVYWASDLRYLFVGYAVEGCAGGFAAVALVTCAYAADVSQTRERRAVSLVVVQGLIYACDGAASLGMGYFVEEDGFFWPLVAVSAALAGSVILMAVIPAETARRAGAADSSPCRDLRRVASFYSAPSGRWRFRLCLGAFALLSQFYLGTFRIDTLYEMNSPFCWTPVNIGMYGAAISVVQPLLAFLFLRVSQCCLTETLIGALAILACSLRQLIYGFSRSDWMLYLAAVFGWGILTGFAMIRTVIIDHANSGDIGAIYAGLGAVEVFTGVTSTVMLTAVYSATVLWMKGLVYVLSGVLCLVPCLLLVFLHVRISRGAKDKSEDLLEPAEPDLTIPIN